MLPKKYIALAIFGIVLNLAFTAWHSHEMSVFFTVIAIVMLGMIAVLVADPQAGKFASALKWLALANLFVTIGYGFYRWQSVASWSFASYSHLIITLVVLIAAAAALPAMLPAGSTRDPGVEFAPLR
jgi:predicted membrane channel-forming protein YqfA (hemolysin III family)